MELELRDELEYHVERQAAEFVARGMSPDQARELAVRQLGDLEDVAQQCRRARRPDFLEPWENWSPAMSIRRFDFRVILPALMLLGAGVGWLAATMTPPRYRSEAVMTAIPQQVFPGQVKDPVIHTLDQSFASIRASLLSRTRLEQLMKEFNLYSVDRSHEILENLIARMRGDIELELRSQADDNGVGSTLTVAYSAPTPELALRVTEKLAAFIQTDSVGEQEQAASRTIAFLEAQVDHLGVRLAEIAQRGMSGRSADDPRRRVERETLESLYARALTNLEEARVQVDLLRRQVGMRLVFLDAARLPERPSNPSHAFYLGVGALAGAILALLVTVGQITLRAWRSVGSRRAEREV